MFCLGEQPLPRITAEQMHLRLYTRGDELGCFLSFSQPSAALLVHLLCPVSPQTGRHRKADQWPLHGMHQGKGALHILCLSCCPANGVQRRLGTVDPDDHRARCANGLHA
jgi:hypothetical protein